MTEKHRVMSEQPSTYSQLPTNLDLTEQILISIGKLIVVWANCESCFYAVYFCLSGRSNGNADIAWASIQSTRRRMELVYNLLRFDEQISKQTKSELFRCLDEFKAVTEARNYYCHAQYATDETAKILVSIDQWGLAPIKTTHDPLFREKSKPANKETVNQICYMADRCLDVVYRVGDCVYSLRDELKLQDVNLPPLPKGKTPIKEK
jgi:hypothetical protein